VAGSLTLDAGALIGLDRRDRTMWLLLRRAVDRGVRPHVPAPVVTQAWRSPRQANLARALRLCDVVDTDLATARRAGELCAAAGTADAVDAIVVASAAGRDDAIVTSDVHDITALVTHAPGVAVIRV
jgi:hypothetical protein